MPRPFHSILRALVACLWLLPLAAAGQTLNIYTQYLDFIGQFVMHCHILDHEDLGMMEIVEVMGEDTGTPTMEHGGHSH